MDLGTANTIIIQNDKIVVDEPSIVALNRRTDKLEAIGEKARQMHGKTPDNIYTIRPLRDGVIADFNAAEQMIRGMIKMINKKAPVFTPSLTMVICIPSGSTEVEIRAAASTKRKVRSFSLPLSMFELITTLQNLLVETVYLGLKVI